MEDYSDRTEIQTSFNAPKYELYIEISCDIIHNTLSVSA